MVTSCGVTKLTQQASVGEDDIQESLTIQRFGWLQAFTGDSQQGRHLLMVSAKLTQHLKGERGLGDEGAEG